MGRKKPTAHGDDDSVPAVTAATAGSKSRKKVVMIDDDEYSIGTELSQEPQVMEEKVMITGKKKGKKGSVKVQKHDDDDEDEDEDEEDSKIDKEEDELVETGFSGKPKKGGFGMSSFGLLGDEDDDNDEDEEEDLGKNKNKKGSKKSGGSLFSASTFDAIDDDNESEVADGSIQDADEEEQVIVFTGKKKKKKKPKSTSKSVSGSMFAAVSSFDGLDDKDRMRRKMRMKVFGEGFK